MGIHRDTPQNHVSRAYALDHEAMLALAEPEPEPFRQVRPSAEDIERWQAWHNRRLAALAHARKSAARSRG
jgi:hypothetical protein